MEESDKLKMEEKGETMTAATTTANNLMEEAKAQLESVAIPSLKIEKQEDQVEEKSEEEEEKKKKKKKDVIKIEFPGGIKIDAETLRKRAQDVKGIPVPPFIEQIDKQLYETNPNVIRTIAKSSLPLYMVRQDLAAILAKHKEAALAMSEPDDGSSEKKTHAGPVVLSVADRKLVAKIGTQLAAMVRKNEKDLSAVVASCVFALLRLRMQLEIENNTYKGALLHILWRCSEIMRGMAQFSTDKNKPTTIHIYQVKGYVVPPLSKKMYDMGVWNLATYISAYRKMLNIQLIYIQFLECFQSLRMLKLIQGKNAIEDAIDAHGRVIDLFLPFLNDNDEQDTVILNIHGAVMADQIKDIRKQIMDIAPDVYDELNPGKLLDAIVVDTTSQLVAALGIGDKSSNNNNNNNKPATTTAAAQQQPTASATVVPKPESDSPLLIPVPITDSSAEQQQQEEQDQDAKPAAASTAIVCPEDADVIIEDE
jgi:hypothetical protein